RKMVHENQAPFRRLALTDRKSLDKIYPLILFNLAGSTRPTQRVTLSDYLGRSSRYKGLVFFLRENSEEETSETKGGWANDHRFILAAAEAAGALVIGIRSEDDEELLRKICLKVGATKAALEKYIDQFVEGGTTPGASLDKVRRNFERFLGAN